MHAYGFVMSMICVGLLTACVDKSATSASEGTDPTLTAGGTGTTAPATGTTAPTTGTLTLATGTGETTVVEDTTSETTTEGDTGPGPLPVCEASECMTQIGFDCGGPEGCFPPCTFVPQNCGFPELCPEVFVQSTEEDMENYTLLTPEAATCFLESLRDRKPGHLSLTWGDVQGWYGDTALSIEAAIDILDDETVLMTWSYDYKGCCGDTYGLSQRQELQPSDFFDVCFSDPSPEALIHCLIGADSNPFSPLPPSGFLPWTTGTCTDAPATCPAG